METNINNSVFCLSIRATYADFAKDVEVDHRRYQVTDTKVTWYEARNDCLRRGGDLLTSLKHFGSTSLPLVFNANKSKWLLPGHSGHSFS